MFALNAQVYLNTVAQYGTELICAVGPDLRMRYVSPSCEAILGWTAEEMTGKGPHEFIHLDDLPAAIAAGKANRKAMGVQGTPVCTRLRRKDGSYAWMDTRASILRDPATGERREIVLVMRDISDRVQREERLKQLATTDGLTGLLNRRGFDESLDTAWQSTRCEGTQMSLLLLDVDRFKCFNDRYGHQVGDDCLRSVANSVQGALLRSADRAARYGGEEFAVILPGTDCAGAMTVAERIRLAVRALGLPNEDCLESGGLVSLSIGVTTAIARQGGTTRVPESLLLAADGALYKAKNHGRNRIALSFLLASPNH